MNSKLFLGFAYLLMLFVLACEAEDEMPDPGYDVPTIYSFDNVSYSGQTSRLAMMSELKSYMSTSREVGNILDANRLQAMFENDQSNAQWAQSYDDSKQLKSKTFESEQATFEALLIELADASASTEEASQGVAGRSTSLDGEKTYLLGANGLDHAQLIEKGLMGGCFYYQSTAVYFGSDRMDVDNETIEPGKGTEMEHHWDEAFGYLGVPIDFPSNTDGLVFWGSYSNSRNEVLNSNQNLMDNFLKGRAAISNDDLISRDDAIESIRKEWELVAVGSAIHYFNDADEQFDDLAIRAHFISEAIGFIYAIQFNPGKTIDNGQVTDLLEELAGSANFADMDIYNTTQEDLLSVRDQLATLYQLEDIKTQF